MFRCIAVIVSSAAAIAAAAVPAHAGSVHALGAGDLVGETKVIAARYEDTFLDIGRAHGVGFEELRKANPEVNAWVPG
ncbi:MAG: LysM peptidoglycan-binding domain-containing protein, partial [Gammaproteobacteria bacterium]|nr:LysM peptidoglycan-binding domain-containing protein [Gammaproteobacteria bacterium]